MPVRIMQQRFPWAGGRKVEAEDRILEVRHVEMVSMGKAADHPGSGCRLANRSEASGVGHTNIWRMGREELAKETE